MQDNKTIVNEITRELQILGKVEFSKYANIIISRNMSLEREEKLLQYASEIYAINNAQWEIHPKKNRTVVESQSNDGLEGLCQDLFGLSSNIVNIGSDIIRIPLGIVNGTVSLTKDMLVEPALEMIIGTSDEIINRTQPYITKANNNPYNAILERKSVMIKELENIN